MTSTHDVKYDVKPYSMFERPKTSHGRRASTGSAVYHEAKPVRRDYQYPDRIDQVQWEDTAGVNDEGQFHGNPGGGDQRIEFHHPSSRDHRRDSGGYQVEGFERPASRRGYPRPGRPFIDSGLDSPRASFEDESYPPSSQPVIVQESKRKTRPKSARRHSTHGAHKTQVFDIPILRPPSSLTRFQPLPSIGSKPDTAPSETDRLVLHTDKLQLDEDEQTDSVSHHKHEHKSGHHERKHKSKYREPIDSDHKSHSKYTEDSDFSSRHSKHHSHHQDVDNEGMLRKGDVRIDKKWSKHTERVHPSPESSPRGDDGRRESSPRGEDGRRRGSNTGGGKVVKVALSPEPTDDEPRLLLAVKSPGDGQRFTRYFRPSSTLREVIQFAEDVSGLDLSSYSIACNAPRRVFTDFNQTCEEVGLQDRTMLYFEQRK